MAYWNKKEYKSYTSLDNYLPASSAANTTQNEFYEFEPGLVLDIVLDNTHDIFKGQDSKLDVSHWPADLDGNQPTKMDFDYTWVGRALIRLLYSQKKTEKEKLIWALPLDSNVSEYPLINEVIICVKYFNKYYYTRKLNSNNFVNNNSNFNIEPLLGGFLSSDSSLKGNRELNEEDTPFKGPTSKMSAKGGFGYEGVLGRYFFFNKAIRSIKRYEGDLLFESRFGQSIRFSAYDGDRNNDKGYNSSFSGYKDYKGTGTTNSYSNLETGGGNPMFIIRNRQRPLVNKGKTLKLHDKLPTIIGTDIEKNVGGYIEEDINNDGSSIHITSGITTSKWVTTCYKSIFQQNLEEQDAYSPSGCSSFVFPILNKDQIVLNTDRIILSTRFGETFHFSKKRYSVITDSEYTVDAHDQIVLTTNNKTVINSPAIYLGQYNETNEPCLLGQTTVNWLYNLCNWLIKHTHWHHHSHPNAGKEAPEQTQMPAELQELIQLRDQLHTLLSKRVFITGGGLSPGADGGSIKDGVSPTTINVSNGDGVPGGYNGSNFRES